ncbi:hypothetical protein [Streptomyces sp. NPDC048242]|uniref:hypothetical protein n=1 Tax=Streptomyces sp. NPDC048242 TaxID=3155026 RepID=UPI003428757C
MEIPDWFAWMALGLAALQALGLVPIAHRLRGPDPVVRTKARLDLLDTLGNLLALGGLILGIAVAASWFWLGLVGFALMTTAYAVKGVHRLHARRAADQTADR